MVAQDAIDWATGEMLAFGSVLMDGHAVRLVGQDTRRGTFGQRHAVLVDRHTAAEYTPLRQFNSGSAKFYAYDSLLSEFAAVGFEYGYSVAGRRAGLLEAQFGDFANGAQTIMDEFISSGEQKWGQRSSVVLLLPHGYEGQGPDHSSARIERFLGCARRQHDRGHADHAGELLPPAALAGLVGRRTPLIVFTPKSMLRLKQATSSVADFASGSFRPVLGDQGELDPAGVARCCCARARSTTTSSPSGRRRPHRQRDRPGRAALPAARRGTAEHPRPVPGRRGGHLGTGGARQHGRLADHGHSSPGDPRPSGPACLAPASSAPAAGSANAHAAEHRAVIDDALGQG